MMDSVSRSMMALNTYLPDVTPPPDLIEHYFAKKTYYPAAINRVLGVLDRGYKHRVTFNGEIGRNYDDLCDRWNEIQCQIARTDESLNDMGLNDGVTDLPRQVKGLNIVTESRRRSGSSSNVTLTPMAVSPIVQTSSRGLSIRPGTRVTSLSPQRRETVCSTSTPRT